MYLILLTLELLIALKKYLINLLILTHMIGHHLHVGFGDGVVRYCQGMGMIAASLLLFLEEEESFWVMCTIVEDLLPASYYSTTLLGMYAYRPKVFLGHVHNIENLPASYYSNTPEWVKRLKRY